LPLLPYKSKLIRFILWVGLVALQTVWGSALDSLRTKELYRDGEFETCTAQLEKILTHPQSLNLRERAFANKYLGVIYSANPATEEKGRYYMNQFIELRPNDNILDLYTSKKIKDIFNEVLAEYRASHGYEKPTEVATKSDKSPIVLEPKTVETRNPMPRPMPKSSTQASSSNHAWIWIASTVAVTGALAVGYYAIGTPEKKITTVEHVMREP
jgi:hypothetical protein